MSTDYQWEIQHQDSPQTLDELISLLLEDRGITDEQSKKMFFDTEVSEIVDSLIGEFKKDTLEAIVQQIQAAMEQNIPIIIHGDYDADGISGTAILWETFYRDLGYTQVSPFIPHRVDHGYGVSTESVDAIYEDIQSKSFDKGLVITVDCGITGRKAISYGQEKGLSFIVTDHHTIQEDKKPTDIPIMHTYELCGAGIAWVFSLLLKKELLGKDIANPSMYEPGLDLVALATLADIQSVVGYNRVLVKRGLELLSKTKRIGLQELYKKAGIENKPIGTYEVGWVIAPRINAMGRLEHALDSLRLLCTHNAKQAEEIAAVMDETNQARQQLTMDAIKDATNMVVDNGWQDDLFILVTNDEWHEGILGLIAGKLVERFGVPAIALAPSEGLYKGSARSVSGFNIAEALKKHERLLIEAGGHAAAAGLSVDTGNTDALRTALQEYAKILFKGEKPLRVLHIDCPLSGSLLSVETAEAIQSLAPHGVDNPRPLFVIQNAVVTNKRLIGSGGNHIKFDLGFPQGGVCDIEAIAFNWGEQYDTFALGDTVSVVGSIEVNTYFDTPSVQIKVKDIRKDI